ncbi:neogenin-like isoform X4 [Portunus trituberculatus]|uniref:neogenin-like isoform X4 n=1 Tax=Portunus trituberculatus TaxID=210409 RepID=UPI001E1CC34F|nr:neogenin-like isoform X4 [Portunus trituberculatus]
MSGRRRGGGEWLVVTCVTLAVCLGAGAAADKGKFVFCAPAASHSCPDGKWSGLSFSVQPVDTVVRRRGPAWLHCKARGQPEPTLTWHRDNSPIDTTSDSRRYVLPNGTLHFTWVNGPRSEQTDEGIYHCQASSPGVGTIVSTGARLSIVGGWEEDALPKFDEQPQDMTVFEGERARFPCALASTPLPTIKWFRNSHPLELDSRMTRLPSGALEIENVATTDEGEYYCQASSLDKSKVSQQATLNVEEAYALRDTQRPMFIARPKSAIGKVGDNITLDCAANGYPEPTVVWLKDGATIDMAHLDTRFLFFGTTRSLQIIGLKQEDKGTYMCRAENREDSVDAVAHIQVQVAPRFVKQPVSTLAYEKEDVELECNVYGEPEPSVYWLKNGELLVETEYFQIVGGNNLKILGLVREDSGMYQCVAHNSAGATQAAAQLRVLKSRRSMPSDPTATTTISTIIQGIPERGSYLPKGRDSDEVHPQAPSAPRLLQAIIASNRFITLAWHEPEFNNDHIVGYSVFYRQEDSLRERVQNVSASSSSEGLDEYKTQISDLIPGSNYMVRVVAHTSNGLVGASTEDVRVFTKPDLDLPSAPENLQVVPTSPTSLEVTWSPPRIARTPIIGYTMFYMQVGSAEEHEVEVTGTSYDLQGLDQFTEYSVWLTAVNGNGRGDATPEVTARTFSDVPSKEPQNVTVEAASSESLIIRWEPPPTEHQNGIITGYKIRYKERGKSGSSKTRTTDGNRRLFPLTELKKSTPYSIKLAALTVNGTGPYTQSKLAETFANDLDENRVPDKPVSLKAVALTDHIRVRWQPPAQHNVMLRGYTIGWGRGVPDIYSKIVDSKQRSYIIDKLEPNTEYVISLRAFNSVGDGQPVYEQVRTRPEEEEIAPTLETPVGVKAVVLTPFTVALQWTDTTLNRNQYISDTRYYTVRYTTFSSASSSSPRFRYINATDVTCLIDNLKPSTVYEFAVKTIKGKRESPWSLVASNTTLVARPSSPPRDVTVVTIPDEPSTVIFNWQPPKQNNGKITGYVIFYTTDPTGSDWVMENVMGDRMTFTVRGLTPSTQYFYKMHARNVKGFGPYSSVGNFTTLPAAGKSIGEPPGWFVDKGSLIVLVIAGVAGAVTLLGVFVALTLYCRRVKTEPRPSIVVGSCSKSNKPDVQPPDLWIHHDHLELKNFDKGERSNSPNHAAIINHTGPEYEPDDKNTTYTSTSTLDRRTPYQSTYLRDQLSEDETDKLLNRRSFKPKPLIMSMDISKDLVGGSTSSSVYSDGTLGRPGYSMPQFSSAGSQGYNSPAENPYSPNPTSSGLAGTMGPGGTPLEGLSLPPQPSQTLLGSLGGPSGSSQYSTINGEGSNTLGKRSGNPLRSFSVPAPPQSAPTTPQPKHIVPGSSGLSSSAGPAGPSGRWTGPSMRVDSLPEHEEANEALLHGYSTEELSQEMANLEGLMKDLSAITANQFNC